MTGSYVLVSGPSGVGLGSSVRRIRPFLGETVPKPIDLEDVLCNELPETPKRLREAGKIVDSPTKIRMRDVTWELPKAVVKELWEGAAELALHGLANLVGGPRILTAKFVYYGGRRHEFYSPVSTRCIKSESLRPSAVVVLIDDVYDMYARLSASGELFDRKSSWESYKKRFETDESIKIDPPFSQRDRQALALRYQVLQLRRILNWRQMEVSVAENIALDLKCPLLVWSTKQLAAPAAGWILDPSLARAYLSHPISIPRRDQRASGAWPEIVQQVNLLQSDLFGHKVVITSPTGIDEMRFRPFSIGDGLGRLPLHSPELGARWPLPPGDLVWEPPAVGDAPEFSRLLDVEDLVGPPDPEDREPNTGRRRDATVRNLEDVIGDQISSRDHLFVEHCRSLLLFRPLFGGKEYTDGVRSEFLHWAHLAKRLPDRRVAFVHFSEDVGKVRSYVDGNPDTANRLESVRSIVGTMVSALTKNDAVRSVRLVRHIQAARSDANMLDEGFMPDEVEAVRQALPSIEHDASDSWLTSYLACGHLGAFISPGQMQVWRDVRDTSHLRETIPEIAAFLRS